ncbi:HTH-type transcriptional regulator CymR [Rubripirellula obstinata]|uniref:HTH-type transcriptional regulator CymR n=1 Tax=Rubripirellula obstinata TaxID=406547 RepID=A0A5B1CJH6_9BACT|nr:Rrf2 family transcriptional regulator [Rubripirellula obstinata]KAA1259603.1 HTH-type transcriptional regulator CymR [Rubripirellula obstinata]
MTISARVHYAALAMAELAARQDDIAPVSIREITDRHGVPGPFLVQILRTLRAAGLVESIRGSHGGYRLAADASTLTLLDIAEAMGCQENGCRTEATPTPADEMLQEIWREAAEASRDVLASKRLIDMVDQVKHGDSSMFYI